MKIGNLFCVSFCKHSIEGICIAKFLVCTCACMYPSGLEKCIRNKIKVQFEHVQIAHSFLNCLVLIVFKI